MGPCLCGDPHCSSCGNPAAAELEAAEESLMEALAAENLNAEEYVIVRDAGIAAVKLVRSQLDAARKQWDADQREAAAELEASEAIRRSYRPIRTDPKPTRWIQTGPDKRDLEKDPSGP